MKRQFEFSSYDKEILSEISFRHVTMKDDLHRLHHWHHQSHVVPFWNENFSLPTYKEHLKTLLADQHQTLYIGYLNDEPISYWESYWAKDDMIANYYDVQNDDQGIHLLFGPKEYLGKGLALPFLRAMTGFQFEHVSTEKIVAEPDINNKKMIHVFKKCGFEPQREISLPDKQGLLMFCQRETFLRRWKDVEFVRK